MPIVVRLEDKRGNALTIDDPNGGTCDAAGDFDRLIPWNDEAYHCLSVVDPYGDTVFNRLQAPLLLDEIRRLDVARTDERERRGLSRLIAMAERCRDGAHLYVRFVGD
jgi:hypothetical protein